MIIVIRGEIDSIEKIDEELFDELFGSEIEIEIEEGETIVSRDEDDFEVFSTGSERCITCRYYKHPLDTSSYWGRGVYQGVGRCLYNPPSLEGSPVTAEDDWCSRWE